MASFVYGTAAREMMLGALALVTDTIKMGLSTSVHVPNKDDEFLDDVGADDFIDGELSGTGYVAGFGNAGRTVVTSRAVVYDTVNDRAEFDHADVTWTAINAGIFAQASLIKEITNDAASIMIANIDGGGDFPVTTNGSDVTVQPGGEGIIQLTV